MNVAYNISAWTDAPCELQAVGNADRPLSAFLSALACWVGGAPLAGSLRGASEAEVEAHAQTLLLQSGVPHARSLLWLRGLTGETWGECQVKSVDGVVLEPYQLAAIASSSVAGMVWNIDMGLGKTVAAVAAAMDAADKGRTTKARCWVICPLNAFGAWQPYVALLQTVYHDVRILSVDSAHKFVAIPPDGGFLIVDEAHSLKSGDSRRTRAVCAVRQQFDIGLCLTGTLLHAGAVSVLPIADCAVPGFAGFANQWSFGAHFRCLEKKTLGSRTVTAVGQPQGEHMERFLKYISRFTISLSTESESVTETLRIPPQEVETVPVGQPWPKIHEEAARVALEMLDNSEDGELPHASAVMHRLLRADLPAKWEAWLSLCAERDLLAQPWVFFAHYRDSLDWLAETLAANDVSFVRVDGDTKQADRVEAVRRFQAGEVACFLGQTTAAGISTNLVAAAHSCMWDSTHKAIDYAQALRRTRRRGQTRRCLHLDMVSNGLQLAAIERVRAGRDFNASAAAWADTKRQLIARNLARADGAQTKDATE